MNSFACSRPSFFSGCNKSNSYRYYFFLELVLILSSTLFNFMVFFLTVSLFLCILFISQRPTLNQKFSTNSNLLSLVLGRIVAVFTYCLPFLETCRIPNTVIEYNYPINFFYNQFLSPIVNFYIFHPLFAFFLFFMLYFLTLLPGKFSFHSFVKFNIIQSILLHLLTSFFGTIFEILPVLLKSSHLGEILANSIFLATLFCIFYSIYHVFRGKYSNIPFISDAVRGQMSFRA